MMVGGGDRTRGGPWCALVAPRAIVMATGEKFRVLPSNFRAVMDYRWASSRLRVLEKYGTLCLVSHSRDT